MMSDVVGHELAESVFCSASASVYSLLPMRYTPAYPHTATLALLADVTFSTRRLAFNYRPVSGPSRPVATRPWASVQFVLQLNVESSTQHRNRTQQNYVVLQIYDKYLNSQTKFTWAMSLCVWTFFVPQPDQFSLALKDLWATPV